AFVIDEEVVETLQADRLIVEDFRHVVGALVDVGIGDDQQNPLRRALDQPAGGLQRCGAGSFRAHQGAGYVEAIFRQQVMQVVAGDATRDVGEFLADEVCVLIGDLLQGYADLFRTFDAAGGHAPRRFASGSGADEGVHPYTQTGAIVGDNLEGFDVVVGFAAHDGVDAAGVVADHAAECAAVMAGRIGGECEVMFLGGVAQVVEDYAGLDAGDPALGINLQNLSHVPGEVEDHGYVAALPGQGSPPAAAEQRGAEFAASGNGGK